MSFFKDFKDDFTQAVNDLLPEDDYPEDIVNTLDSDDQKVVDDNSEAMKEWLETAIEMETVKDKTFEVQTEENIMNINEMESEELLKEEVNEMNKMNENIDLELLDTLSVEDETTTMEEDLDNKIEESKNDTPSVKTTGIVNDSEVTIISKGTVINGSISSDGSLDIQGSVTGDVDCLGKLSITGNVNGNTSASEVYVNSERMEGSIASDGSVKVGLGTVIIGDIVATSSVIAGAVKGEIDINGPIVIDSTAIIKGNIKAKSVQINNGAVIEGFCSLAYSEIDVDNIFE